MSPYKYHHIYTINLTESKAPCEGVVNGENICKEEESKELKTDGRDRSK